MKKTKGALLLLGFIWLIVISMAMGVCLADWDDVIPVETPRRLDSYLQPVPFENLVIYGNSEKTKVLYNLIRQQDDIEKLKKQANTAQQQLKELEALRKELKRLADEVEELKKQIEAITVDKAAKTTSTVDRAAENASIVAGSDEKAIDPNDPNS